jgi:DNA-binding XRE family transcriptional regulator
VNLLRNWLKNIRYELELTHAAIAKEVGVSRQYIGMIETGVATPHPDTAKLISKALNFEKYGFDWTKFYTSNDNDDTKN